MSALITICKKKILSRNDNKIFLVVEFLFSQSRYSKPTIFSNGPIHCPKAEAPSLSNDQENCI